MDEKYTCYVFLADDPAQNEILNAYCKVNGYTKEEAHKKVTQELQIHKKDNSYELKYMGVIHFQDVAEDIINRQEELFDKYDSVWVLNCAYSKK